MGPSKSLTFSRGFPKGCQVHGIHSYRGHGQDPSYGWYLTLVVDYLFEVDAQVCVNAVTVDLPQIMANFTINESLIRRVGVFCCLAGVLSLDFLGVSGSLENHRVFI